MPPPMKWPEALYFGSSVRPYVRPVVFVSISQEPFGGFHMKLGMRVYPGGQYFVWILRSKVTGYLVQCLTYYET